MGMKEDKKYINTILQEKQILGDFLFMVAVRKDKTPTKESTRHDLICKAIEGSLQIMTPDEQIIIKASYFGKSTNYVVAERLGVCERTLINKKKIATKRFADFLRYILS